MTPKEVANYLRIHHVVVKRWLNAKQLKGTKINSRGDWRIKKKDLEDYLDKMNK